jgi:hypothetical protein
MLALWMESIRRSGLGLCMRCWYIDARVCGLRARRMNASSYCERTDGPRRPLSQSLEGRPVSQSFDLDGLQLMSCSALGHIFIAPIDLGSCTSAESIVTSGGSSSLCGILNVAAAGCSDCTSQLSQPRSPELPPPAEAACGVRHFRPLVCLYRCSVLPSENSSSDRFIGAVEGLGSNHSNIETAPAPRASDEPSGFA